MELSLSSVPDILLTPYVLYDIVSSHRINEFELAIDILEELVKFGKKSHVRIPGGKELLRAMKLKYVLELVKRQENHVSKKIEKFFRAGNESKENQDVLHRKFLTILVEDKYLQISFFESDYTKEFGIEFLQNMVKMTENLLLQIVPVSKIIKEVCSQADSLLDRLTVLSAKRQFGVQDIRTVLFLTNCQRKELPISSQGTSPSEVKLDSKQHLVSDVNVSCQHFSECVYVEGLLCRRFTDDKIVSDDKESENNCKEDTTSAPVLESSFSDCKDHLEESQVNSRDKRVNNKNKSKAVSNGQREEIPSIDVGIFYTSLKKKNEEVHQGNDIGTTQLASQKSDIDLKPERTDMLKVHSHSHLGSMSKSPSHSHLGSMSKSPSHSHLSSMSKSPSHSHLGSMSKSPKKSKKRSTKNKRTNKQKRKLRSQIAETKDDNSAENFSGLDIRADGTKIDYVVLNCTSNTDKDPSVTPTGADVSTDCYLEKPKRMYQTTVPEDMSKSDTEGKLFIAKQAHLTRSGARSTYEDGVYEPSTVKQNCLDSCAPFNSDVSCNFNTKLCGSSLYILSNGNKPQSDEKFCDSLRDITDLEKANIVTTSPLKSEKDICPVSTSQYLDIGNDSEQYDLLDSEEVIPPSVEGSPKTLQLEMFGEEVSYLDSEAHYLPDLARYLKQ